MWYETDYVSVNLSMQQVEEPLDKISNAYAAMMVGKKPKPVIKRSGTMQLRLLSWKRGSDIVVAFHEINKVYWPRDPTTEIVKHFHTAHLYDDAIGYSAFELYGLLANGMIADRGAQTYMAELLLYDCLAHDEALDAALKKRYLGWYKFNGRVVADRKLDACMREVLKLLNTWGPRSIPCPVRDHTLEDTPLYREAEECERTANRIDVLIAENADDLYPGRVRIMAAVAEQLRREAAKFIGMTKGTEWVRNEKEKERLAKEARERVAAKLTENIDDDEDEE